MVDQIQERVCCLCGDVGFPDRLFRCSRCRFRFQHSYCSNYYCGSMELSSSSSSMMCDWCQCEAVGNRNGMISGGSNSRSKSSSTMSDHQYNYGNSNNNNYVGTIRSEYTSRERIKNQHHQDDHPRTSIKVPSSSNNGSKNTGVPSPRPNSHRRYKLLKDVMC